MFRFSEWLEIESFVDSVDSEIYLNRCVLETTRSILRVARIALSPHLMNESEGCPPEYQDMPRNEVMKKIHDSMKVIRQHGILKRKRLVQALGDIKDWMAKLDTDEDLNELDLSGLSDIISPKEIDERDTLQMAVLILQKLEYLTTKESEDILAGLELPENNKKSISAHDKLSRKIAIASTERGNDVRIDGNVDFAASYEQLRCAILKAYGDRIEGKTRRNMLRKGYKDFLADDLTNDLFELVLDLATRRKWSKGKSNQLLPWGEGTTFEELLKGWLGFKVSDKVADGQLVVSEVSPNGPSAAAGMKPKDIVSSIDGSPLSTKDDLKSVLSKIEIGQKVRIRIVRDGRTEDIEVVAAENLDHMDNYIGISLSHKSKSIGQRAARVNNPLSGNDHKEETHNNKPRKVKLIKDDIAAHAEWKERKNSPDTKISNKAGANPLQFYIDYINEHPEYKEEAVSATGKDRMRADIMRDIQLELTFSSKARQLGLSWNPAEIEKILASYSSNFLRSNQRGWTAASELLPKDSNGSSDEVMTSLTRSQETDDELTPDTPTPMDRATSYSSGSDSESGLMSKFFRPYLIRATKQIAARGERSAGRAVFLCLKFGIACSFTSNQKGEPISLTVNEPENFDAGLDDKVRSYMFDRFSSDEGSQSLFSGGSAWDQWSHEKKTSSRAMDSKSFCNVFFDSITEKSNNQSRIVRVYSELPESSKRIPDGAGGYEEVKHYEYDPRMFPASWSPSGRTNSLKAASPQSLNVVLKGDKDLRGILSELCDTIFDEMIRKGNQSLKSLMMARSQPPQPANIVSDKAKEEKDARYAAALARTTASKMTPQAPNIRSLPSPTQPDQTEGDIKNP